jgi:hypothetical protein
MSTTYNAFDHKTWDAAGWKDFGDFSEMIEYVNQSEYSDGQLEGEWWWADDAARTVYYGSFGNYNSPGASSYTYAEVYEEDEEEEYLAEVKQWEAFPEYLESEDEDDDVDDSDDLDYVEVDTLTAPRVEMIAGYAHEYGSQDAGPDDMDMVVYTPRGDESVVEYRVIDGSWHVVFHCPDGMYRAQTCVSLGVQNPI